MFATVPDAVSLFFQPGTLLILVIALVVGMATSILPGIGTVLTIALLMSFTFAMEPHVGIMFLVVLIGAGGFSGAMTSILINVPGETQNAATLLDGYPMSQQGRAGEAIGAAAVASALGAALGVVVLVASIPFMRSLILAFGPPEMFAMTVAGIALISVIAKGNPIKGLVAGMVGMAIGFIGTPQAFGGQRFTFGFPQVYEGIPLVPLIIGLFAIPEVYELLRKNRPVSQTGKLVAGGIRRGMVSVLRHPVTLVRSSVIGTGVGIIPGVGASVAPWIAYFVEKQRSSDPDSFGNGNVLGVIAPEASNDSKDGGAMMPLLAFGIPGSLAWALVLSAFLFHNILPGQRLFQGNMELVWLMIFALLFANFGTSIVGLALANVLIKITLVPAVVLAPIVMVLAMVGSFASHRALFSVGVAVVVGFIAIGMERANYPRPPVLIAFVLFPMVERYFQQSLQISRGSYEFFLRPITFGILLVIVATLAYPFVKGGITTIRRRRRERGGEVPAERVPVSTAGGGTPTTAGDGGLERAPEETPTAATVLKDQTGRRVSPVAGVLVGGLFLAMAVTFLALSGDLNPNAARFPRIVLTPMVGLLAVLVVMDARRLVVARQEGLPIAVEREQFSDLWVAGWLVLLPVLMILIGMVPGAGVYVLLARLFYDRTPFSLPKLRMGLILGLGTSFGIHAIFTRYLRVRLLEGFFL